MSTVKPMVAARVFAVVVIAGVGAAAFVLSFTTLRDLATLAHIPAGTAWLFPLIVDGTIIQATLGWLVLAKSAERTYFVWVLAAGSLVSVAGNSIHAVANGHPLPGWLCAVVAAIAPISLLIDTHGLAVLFRAAQTASTTPAPSTEEVSEPVAAVEDSSPAAPIPVSVPEEPVTDPVPDPAPVPAPVPAAAPARPARPVVAPVRPVRPVRPVQPMLPIAVPAGS
ncbi:putative phage recombinase [Nocardia nova SH22a]|uniref:Putative phage recombinase n=1 Tax=Nocardia nova SH22a TaxID=1415166 RepID=W5TDE5_9NOCA|nr:DUF2637 domain-containing protein [Nocardia nova]AHH17262.1 putative phage recombinase [Nocardia nova SH22a]